MTRFPNLAHIIRFNNFFTYEKIKAYKNFQQIIEQLSTNIPITKINKNFSTGRSI